MHFNVYFNLSKLFPIWMFKKNFKDQISQFYILQKSLSFLMKMFRSKISDHVSYVKKKFSKISQLVFLYIDKQKFSKCVHVCNHFSHPIISKPSEIFIQILVYFTKSQKEIQCFPFLKIKTLISMDILIKKSLLLILHWYSYITSLNMAKMQYVLFLLEG